MSSNMGRLGKTGDMTETRRGMILCLILCLISDKAAPAFPVRI
jgi:hypothetical protein